MLVRFWESIIGLKFLVVLFGTILAVLLGIIPLYSLEKPVPEPEARWITTDHSKHEALQQDFQSGPEVTQACLSCHTEAAKQFMQTIHWTWLCPRAPKEAKLGKAGLVINNFCIAMPSNYPRCTSCHAGYGFKGPDFDFTDQTKVDCLVCHEQTGTYKKFPAGAGNPVSQPTPFGPKKVMFYPPDWKKVAQSVGRPTRSNCGVCHFYGGGGDGVKHGDLDSSMTNPHRELDVHMAVDGKNFTCARCHTTVVHKIAGRCYKTPAVEKHISLIEDDLVARISCVACHTSTPHHEQKANDHTDKVACQACHIPYFARELPTKMRWDWSTAGKMNEAGKPLVEIGELGKPVYDGMKGDFIWAKNVKPEYYWFNGSIENVMATTIIDPSKPVVLTRIQGERNDPKARIFPFKVHRGKTPYDRKNKTMIVPHLFPPKKGSGAFWADYDWKIAIQQGMDHVGLPFSGEYGFVETEYVYQTTHMVAPKEKVVSCQECHTEKNSRLAALNGFYMPGRDGNQVLNIIGWLVVIGSLIGVFVHGIGRVVASKRANSGKE